ncbi:MAG: hypothetical protein ACREPB_08240 [Arenimonas sp.]
MRFLPISFLLYLACAFGAQAVSAQPQSINRCQSKDGKIIYTDKKCEDVDAVLQELPKPASSAVGNSGYGSVRTCARTQDDLLWDLRGALENGDINRAAGLFLWSGDDTAQANKRLDQLNLVSYQSLISVDLLFPESENTQVQFDEDGNIIEAPARGPPVPYGIRVDFYKNKKQTETGSFRFSIQKHLQCYWVRF